MAALVLSDREQKAMRALLAVEPVAGSPIPPRDFLENLAVLVPSDAVGAALAQNSGTVTDFREAPGGYYERFDNGEQHTGPFYLGIMHWSRQPLAAAKCKAILPGHKDGLAVGFRSGPDAVAQVFWDRRRKGFTDRDLAIVDLLLPVLQRHLRQAPAPHLPADLTVQERRVLMQVATGLSNAEVAAALFISPATVRKHLENSFRKLGVTCRLAAVVAFEGRPLTGAASDRAVRLARNT